MVGLVIPAEAASATFDLTSLVQYGVLGVVLILVLFGFLWAKPSVDRILADKASAEKQRDALLETYQTQVIPVLNEVKDHVVPGMAKVLDQQEELRRSVDDLRDEVKRQNR